MGQVNIFGDVEEKPDDKRICPGINKIRDGELEFVPHFFTSDESSELFNLLRNSIEWQQESMKVYGKSVMFPRLTAWYGESDKSYSFSGITLQPKPWTKELLLIKRKLRIKVETDFNS